MSSERWKKYWWSSKNSFKITKFILKIKIMRAKIQSLIEWTKYVFEKNSRQWNKKTKWWERVGKNKNLMKLVQKVQNLRKFPESEESGLEKRIQKLVREIFPQLKGFQI